MHDGGWVLHLLPLSFCQAGDQPTAPGLKPSLHQAHEEEEENRREAKQSNDKGEEGQRTREERTNGKKK